MGCLPLIRTPTKTLETLPSQWANRILSLNWWGDSPKSIPGWMAMSCSQRPPYQLLVEVLDSTWAQFSERHHQPSLDGISSSTSLPETAKPIRTCEVSLGGLLFQNEVASDWVTLIVTRGAGISSVYCAANARRCWSACNFAPLLGYGFICQTDSKTTH
jgi:hypothetical protein